MICKFSSLLLYPREREAKFDDASVDRKENCQGFAEQILQERIEEAKRRDAAVPNGSNEETVTKRAKAPGEQRDQKGDVLYFRGQE